MTVYDDSFYNTIRDGAQRSAMIVAPIVTSALGEMPKRVIDIGCGEGHWAKAFGDLCRAEVIGIDGEYTADKTVLGDRFLGHDISQPLPMQALGKFDMAICLEVAEHLYADRARSFVAELCYLAPIVLFSAALPAQGGTHHVNERWPSYWVDLFAEHGYKATGALRWLIWDNPYVENWYCQNLMLMVHESAITDEISKLFEGPSAAPFPVVHPVLYGARVGVPFP